MVGASASGEGNALAAQYLRTSVAHRAISIEAQRVAIADYAIEHRYEIVRTYADEGKSGLSLKGRTGLKQLLNDALSLPRLFDAILIYDVSRWGRFRDPDEAAHYEFLCRQAGIAVVYCAEPFENDSSATSGILKNLKRVMAHEYSRELSEKLTRAHLQQARLGYRQGGPVIYGFGRLVVDANNDPKFTLRPGQRKASRDDRVKFALGTADEQKVVRLIFSLYVEKGLTLRKVARHLVATAVPSKDGRPWTQSRVHALLTSELCIGHYVYNQTCAKLQARRSRNPEIVWVRASAGTPPVVSNELFARAQACLVARRTRKRRSTELLDDLRRLLKENGYLSEATIEAAPGLASVSAYRAHFGTISEAYRLIGYIKPMFVDSNGRAWRREHVLLTLRSLYRAHSFLSCDLIDKDRNLPSYQAVRKKLGTMGDIYALIGAPPRSRSDILQQAFARRKEQTRESRALRRPGREYFSLDQITDRLRVLLAENGYLSVPLMKSDSTLPSVTTIIKRFGSVVQAYRAAGWTVDRAKLATLRNRRRLAHARLPL